LICYTKHKTSTLLLIYREKDLLMEQAQRLSEIRELDWLAPITREALRLACEEARELRSPRVYPEHLLLLQYPQRMIPYEKREKSLRSSDRPAPLSW
jgi:hypothetical protein